jgi:hypothetical protein
MALRHYTTPNSHDRGEVVLRRSTRETLDGLSHGFLSFCRVDELSPFTIDHYRVQTGMFIRFCSAIGLVAPDKVEAGIKLVEPKEVFLIQGEDQVGAVSIVLSGWTLQTDVVADKHRTCPYSAVKQTFARFRR